LGLKCRMKLLLLQLPEAFADTPGEMPGVLWSPRVRPR
jgi:hypothetical protein